jgi:hypothetical protein
MYECCCIERRACLRPDDPCAGAPGSQPPLQRRPSERRLVGRQRLHTVLSNASTAASQARATRPLRRCCATDTSSTHSEWSWAIAIRSTIGARNVNMVLREREEIRLSLWLEQQMRERFGSERRAKEEIFARYASFVYMGNGQYGFARAAAYYFGRPLSRSPPTMLTKRRSWRASRSRPATTRPRRTTADPSCAAETRPFGGQTHVR